MSDTRACELPTVSQSAPPSIGVRYTTRREGQVWIYLTRDRESSFKHGNEYTHQLLAYADDVNILGGSIHTLKENAEALVAATREIGLEVSADKTKYMVKYRDQNAGRNHSVRIDNSTFERMEDFKYL